MSNFNKAYDIILEDIIQSVTPEELKERQEEYSKMKLKMMFERLIKEGHMVKNPDGSYDIDENIDLYDSHLKGLKDTPYALNKVNGYFSCSYNLLTSLEGCPKIVNGGFYCYNNNLTSLEGCPIQIDTHFNCSHNLLTSLEGCPKTVNGSFTCNDNLKKFTKEYVRKLCNVKGRVYV